MKMLLLISGLLMPGEVRISTLDGQTKSGELTSISTENIVLKESGSETTFSVSDVMNVQFSEVKAAVSSEQQQATLADGSVINGLSATRNAKSLTLTTTSLGNLEIDNSSVRTIRLQPDNPAFRSQWNTFQQRASEKDLLIVAKRDGSGLDFLAGVVSAIAADKIDFLLDGDTVPVPAARVYGVVFAIEANEKGAPAEIKLSTNQGDVVGVRLATFAGNMLTVETSWGQTLALTTDNVSQLDFSGGRLQYLSDLEPIEETFAGVDPEGSLLTGLISDEHQRILFGPRRDSSMEKQSKLRLRGKEYSKGLCLHSKTVVAWAIEKKYSSLDCVIGVDDEVAFNGKYAVSVKISGDDEVLFEKLIATTDQPIPVNVPLAGVSTLEVTVDYGDGDSTCDWLDLADAKLIVAKEQTN